MEQTPQTPEAAPLSNAQTDQPPQPVQPVQPVTPATDPQADQSDAIHIASWPGAFGLYKYSREAVLRSLSTLILLAVIGFGVGFVLGLFSPSHRDASGMSQPTIGPGWVILELVGLLFSVFMKSATYFTLINSVRGRRVELGEAFKAAPRLFLKLFLLDILVFVVAVLSIVALIIPAFFIIPRLALAQYFLIGQNMGVLEAFKASWRATKGNVGKVWGIIGATIVMVLPCLTIIGSVATIYLLFMYGAAFAILFQYVSTRSAASAVEPNATPAPDTPTPAAA